MRNIDLSKSLSINFNSIVALSEYTFYNNDYTNCIIKHSMYHQHQQQIELLTARVCRSSVLFTSELWKMPIFTWRPMWLMTFTKVSRLYEVNVKLHSALPASEIHANAHNRVELASLACTVHLYSSACTRPVPRIPDAFPHTWAALAPANLVVT